MTYKINMDIPGWNYIDILNVLGEYASNVPTYGNILEMGALFGRTTYTLGYNKLDSVKLTTIDIWNTIPFIPLPHDGRAGLSELELLNSLVKNMPPQLAGDDFFDLWKIFTKGIENLEAIRSYTNLPNDAFPMFDLIVHDASHNFDDVYADLIHWFPKLKPGCPMIIDDYEPQFPGLVAAVDYFVKENNITTEMVTGRNILLRKSL